MKRLFVVLALLPSLTACAAPSPKSDGTQRQTARPWTGNVDIFETKGRDQVLRLPEVFKDLNINRGKRVADIGAGGGWLSVRLARAVGPRGVVYAQDILPKYTTYIEGRARRERLSNIKTVLGTTSDPKLAENSLDAAVILNAYHEFDQPLGMLTKIKDAMKTGGRIGIIERDTDDERKQARDAYAQTGEIKRRVGEIDDNNELTDDHTLALDIVKREGEKIGLRFIGSRELGEDKYLAVFEK